MNDVIIVGGFSGYSQDQSFAVESPFLLSKNGIFCDTPGLYKALVDPKATCTPTDIEAPPYVCYVLKKLLHDKGLVAEMIFYLDQELERLSNFLRQPHRAVFLSTTLLPSKSQVNNAVSIIRKYAPDSIIICGGILVDRSMVIRKKFIEEGDLLYEPCKADYFFLDNLPDTDSGIDLFIISDPLLDIAESVLAHLKKGRHVSDIPTLLPNTAYFNNEKWHFSSTITAPPPALPEIDWSIFRSDEIRRAVPLSRSKGCPSRCRFCNFHIAVPQEKSLPSFEKEINSLLANHSKAEFLALCDDNICKSKKSIFEFADFMASRKYPVQWNSFFDARFLDDELAGKLKYSGCNQLKIGMESASDTILRNMNKPCTTTHYRRAVNALAQTGISITAFFITGFPGETTETIKETIDTINSFTVPQQSLNQFFFFPFFLFPLSPIFEKEDRLKYGITGYMSDWRHKTMDFKTAEEAIPGIIRQITTMQPQHGNIEKMIVENKKILSEVDIIRGDLIRKRLTTGSIDPVLIDKLEALVRQLVAKKDSSGNLYKLV